jgi:hypothetical protein
MYKSIISDLGPYVFAANELKPMGRASYALGGYLGMAVQYLAVPAIKVYGVKRSRLSVLGNNHREKNQIVKQ